MVETVRFELTYFLFPKQEPFQLGHVSMVESEALESSSRAFQARAKPSQLTLLNLVDLAGNAPAWFLLARQATTLCSPKAHLEG